MGVKDRHPKKTDSPILAVGDKHKGSMNIAALHWLDDDYGWEGNEYVKEKMEAALNKG